MILKPQDTLLVLKYWSIRGQGLNELKVKPIHLIGSIDPGPGEFNKKPSVRQLAESIKVSPGEVSKSTKRLVAAKLLVDRNAEYFVERRALQEWLCYGVRHAYPVESNGFGRGMPTAWNCPRVRTDILPPDPPVVWPVSGGTVEGTMIKPIHDSVPFAASNDELLYEALSLVDAIRLGKPRELAVARDELAITLESYRNHWSDTTKI
ncbi:MAG: hypothetical protein RKH07_13995 [Gammaproteobacteria bacterium]